ncbi:hypothetical protein ROU73_004582 [Escherichia coli]|uniref:hypothetical protein n=1 Tax=Escherichia coli TaxID=562 RepID=UPI00145C2F6B|nr:hypothetical protein [Escherichia coli]EED0306644.1 hypothetical protein [Escherichia coli]EGK3843802.1 hypothetical protein [Escherichia coli]EHK6131276.1 hypothetical protein [Escherichia coli]EHM4467448.1 hypothetical protein [Escherichia coli]EHM4565834.1 hypothetical protein [Escherichia coli]
MKKVLCALCMLISANVLAGGAGGTTGNVLAGEGWQPSISPINCVIDTGQGWQYNNSTECTEVINNGYAKGVRYSSSLIYDDGYTQNFSVIVAPGQLAKVVHEKDHGNYKFGTTWDAVWVR